MSSDFNTKVVAATKWSSITEIGAKLVAPIVNLILARLLTPDAFGVVATITMVVSFAEIFSESGCPKYLVQHEFSNENDVEDSTNVAFWSNMAISLLMWVIVILFASPIAELVGSKGHELAIIVMGTQIPLLSVANILKARFRRDFDFKTLFVVRIITAMIPLLVTVPLAIGLRSYWALVYGTLTRDFVSVGILLKLSKWKPAFSFKFAKLREMFSFTSWTIVENITIWMTSYTGTFIVGRALSPHYLGLYKTTVTTVDSYLSVITAITMPVLFAALSRCQENNTLFMAIFKKFQRMVALLVFPLGVGIFVFREFVTMILLGSQWMDTADFLGMWSLSSSVIIVVSHFNSELIRSKGYPKLSTLIQILYLGLLIPVLYWAAGQDYETFTTLTCVVRIGMLIISMTVVRGFFGLSWFAVIKNVGIQLCAAIVMGVFGHVLLLVSRDVLWQIVAIMLSGAFYFFLIAIFPSGRKMLFEVPLVHNAVTMIHEKSKKLFPNGSA